VVLRASAGVATLVEYHHRPHRSAGRGRHGEGDLRRGADGNDTVLLVPVGTVVTEGEGRQIADLLHDGNEVVVAAGGRGGRGNASFRTARRRAPRFAELGEPGQERWVRLELKLVADVALVGFPNAGKSSLIARLSAAKPKIADYPFTTLAPNLGVVRTDDLDFVVADVPGLIEGAGEGRGLGHEFLRHVERASVLVHVLDCASYEQRDPRSDLEIVLRELASHEEVLTRMPESPPGWAAFADRPALVFLNKADADAETAEIVAPDLRAAGWEVIVGSAVTGQGVERLRRRLGALVTLARAQREEAGEELLPRPVLRPMPRDGTDFAVERLPDSAPAAFRVAGPRIDRWVVMTDFANDEAVRYLQGRLVRAGVERELEAAGARRGDAVEIAGAVFDFDPDADKAGGDEVSDEVEAADEPDGEEPGEW
jgi:GTPase